MEKQISVTYSFENWKEMSKGKISYKEFMLIDMEYEVCWAVFHKNSYGYLEAVEIVLQERIGGLSKNEVEDIVDAAMEKSRCKPYPAPGCRCWFGWWFTILSKKRR